MRGTRRSVLGNALTVSIVSGLLLVTIWGLLAEDADSGVAVLVDALLQLVAIIAALAIFIGVLNLLVSIHLRRFISFQRGWFYSMITILAALAVVFVYLVDRTDGWSGELSGDSLSPRLFQVLQVSIESALAGLIAFFLIYGAYRMMNERVRWTSVLFLSAVLVVLLGASQFEGLADLASFRDWLVEIPVAAGTRGLLIGIGLGTVTVGVRLLLAQDRFYR